MKETFLSSHICVTVGLQHILIRRNTQMRGFHLSNCQTILCNVCVTKHSKFEHATHYKGVTYTNTFEKY